VERSGPARSKQGRGQVHGSFAINVGEGDRPNAWPGLPSNWVGTASLREAQGKQEAVPTFEGRWEGRKSVSVRVWMVREHHEFCTMFSAMFSAFSALTYVRKATRMTASSRPRDGKS
jgi:hypothetical protein